MIFCPRDRFGCASGGRIAHGSILFVYQGARCTLQHDRRLINL
jgi:hypothetical protein